MKKHRALTYWLIGLIVIGTVFQCIFLFFLMNPNELFWYDPIDYHSIGKGLAEGLPFSTPDTLQNLYRAPGYPFVLAFMMKIVGPSIVNLRLFHIALFPVFLLTLYKLGALWKGKWVGLISVLFAVLYPYYIYQPLTLYPESFLLYLFPGMLLLALLIRTNRRVSYIVLLSVLIALATMIRPTSIFLIPVAFFLICWRNKLQMKKILMTGILLVLIPAAAVCSWMIRNQMVHGNFVFTTTISENLYLSYNENATWNQKKVTIPELVKDKIDATDDFFKKQDVYKDEAIKYIKDNPTKAATTALIRCLDLWNPIPRTTTDDGFSQMKFKLLLAIPYSFLLIAGFIGIIKKRRSIFVQSLVLLMVFNTLLNGIIVVSVRYRLVTDFAFIIIAAFMIVQLINKLFPTLSLKMEQQNL